MRFRQVNNTRVNITSSLDLQDSYQRFGLMTRELAADSSKYVYRLEIYNFQNMAKQSSINVYESYDELKHFIKFISDKNAVAVTTKFQINFYQIDPLELRQSYAHEQINLYDLETSHDGELVVLVGEFIKVWRTNGYRPATFPHIIASARYCSFSHDNQYMAIASNNQINIYLFSRETGEYIFTQLTSVQSPVENQDITSIDFSPNDSNRLVVGFLNVSPQFFEIDTGFFIPLNDIQPQASSNAKKAVFMPDARRFLSSDYRNGVGLWPGVGNSLFYREGYLLYDLHPNDVGTRFVGYVWQQVKMVDIEVECSPENFQTTCPCEPDFRWDLATYSCQPLSCLQNEFATGQRRNNQCVCIDGYYFNRAIGRCMLSCAGIQNSVQLNLNNNFCYCQNNYSWDSTQRRCTFNCINIPYSTGALISSNQCECSPDFIWDSSLNECVCPPYRKPLGRNCICYDQYFEDENGKCILDCNQIPNNSGSTPSQQECVCVDGYYFSDQNQFVGCKLDCSRFEYTRELSSGFDTCQCTENMNWVDNACQIDCSKVEFASVIPTGENRCNCAVNYLWIASINECGKNCTGVSYVNESRQSTLRACPCITNFNWNEVSDQCEVDCTKINNTNPYSLANPVECECRDAFNWVNDEYLCRIDCDRIWDAGDRVNNYECQCRNDKTFNTTKLTCDETGSDSLFSSGWTIAVFVISIVAFILIVIVLVRYCWQFKTKNNKEHEKKLKTNDDAYKPKRSRKRKDLLQENVPMSDERIRTGTTL